MTLNDRYIRMYTSIYSHCGEITEDDLVYKTLPIYNKPKHLIKSTFVESWI